MTFFHGSLEFQPRRCSKRKDRRYLFLMNYDVATDDAVRSLLLLST